MKDQSTDTGTNKDSSVLLKRQQKSVSNFLNGKAKNAYQLSPWYKIAFQKAGSDADLEMHTNFTSSGSETAPAFCEEENEISSNHCCCAYPLKSGKAIFDSFKHIDKEAIRRRKTNKTGRNISAQNGWLLAACFDINGNYIYHRKCICKILKVNKKRLTRIHSIAIRLANQDVEVMHKNKVPDERIKDVVLPEGLNPEDALEWWASLPSTADVTLRPDTNTHKLQNCRSNNAKKEETLKIFLDFIDCNRQFNGRAEGSRGARFYLNGKFTYFDVSDIHAKNKKKILEKDQRNCLVQEFNRVQRELDFNAETIGKNTARSWLKLYRPDTRLSPHKTDYCDFCSEINSHRQAALQTASRMHGTASQEIIEYYKELAESYSIYKEEHLKEANKARDVFEESRKKSRSQAIAIQEIEDRTVSAFDRVAQINEITQQKIELHKLKHDFIHVICGDFMQSANLPYWGESPQPGKTYYQKKIVYDVFGIVDNSWNHKYVYVSHERAAGTKNSNHTVNYFHHYFNKFVPSWVRKIEVWLDNAGATNKNKYIMDYFFGLIDEGVFDDVRIRFMTPGHTKFPPDILFSLISKTYHLHDVFNTQQLLEIISQYARVTFMDGNNFFAWKEYLEACYGNFTGIRSYYDFHLYRNKEDNTVKIEGRKTFSTDIFTVMDIHKYDNEKPGLHSYAATGRNKEFENKFNNDKLKDLLVQYNSYIPDEYRFDWLPPRCLSNTDNFQLRNHSEPITSELAKRQLEAEKSGQRKVISDARKRAAIRKRVAEKECVKNKKLS